MRKCRAATRKGSSGGELILGADDCPADRAVRDNRDRRDNDQLPPAARCGSAALPNLPAVDLLAADEHQLGGLRWNSIAVVLQSSMNALNPVLRVGAQMTDVLRTHRVSQPASAVSDAGRAKVPANG